MKVLAIGYGKNLYTPGIEQDRMVATAELTSGLDMVVITDTADTVVPHTVGKLSLYATGGTSRLGKVLKTFMTVRHLLRHHAYDVITTQDPFETGFVGYLLGRMYKVPVVVQEHGDFFSTPHWRQEQCLNVVRYHLGLWLLRRVARVRVVTNRIKQTLIAHGVSANTIVVLPVAVPIEKFLAVTADVLAEPVQLLTVARLVPQKNLPLLLRAFARVLAEYPHVSLTIVGDGPEKVRITQFIVEHNLESAVTLVPWSNDVPALMAKAQVYVLSSNYEGYARVIPEAMAAGLPIVMTDVGCARELCLDGVHGTIVPVGDEEAFANALKDIIASPSAGLPVGERVR